MGSWLGPAGDNRAWCQARTLVPADGPAFWTSGFQSPSHQLSCCGETGRSCADHHYREVVRVQPAPPVDSATQLALHDVGTYAEWFACLAEPMRVRLLHAVGCRIGR
jgi:hypothetical protein